MTLTLFKNNPHISTYNFLMHKPIQKLMVLEKNDNFIEL